jgi:phage shock protein PspC (stress-responsive transcriptional regulator)
MAQASAINGLASRAISLMLHAMMDNDPMSKPLMRVRQGALIAGVCGGIAKWLGLDPTIVRFLYAALTLLSAAFPGIIIYILLWVLMPREPE